MNTHWNLDSLYTSFDSKSLAEDLSKLEAHIQELSDLVKSMPEGTGSPVDTILRYISLTEDASGKASLLHAYAQLTYSVNTSDNKAYQWIEKIEAYNSRFTEVSVLFQRWLKELKDLELLMKDNPSLTDYSFFLKEQVLNARFLLTDEEEILLAKMQNTGSDAWGKLQDHTVSSLMIDFDGEQKPLSIIRNLAYSEDSAIRKRAYEAELNAYPSIENISAFSLNSIKGEVITVAEKRGYSSPLEMTLYHSRMDEETLNAMFTAIKEYLPLFREYLKKKARLLGHNKSLPFFDLFAPLGDSHRTYSLEEAKDFITEKFSSFSESLGNYARMAFESEWIDSEPRRGKVGGAFCSNLHTIGESRIMTNFTGSFNDVRTLAHELGHGYHGECLKGVSILNADYPMPLAETASIFCETIINQEALKGASPSEALMILDSELMNATQVIVDIYSRYLFETALFEGRKNASLSVDELKAEMLKAQMEAYGDGLDPEFLHPNMWTCKPHYYDAKYNFYNFPYAFGLLFAKGLYAKYLEQGKEFIPRYEELLRISGSLSIHSVLATMGIDSHSAEFFRSSLKRIGEDIEKFKTL